MKEGRNAWWMLVMRPDKIAAAIPRADLHENGQDEIGGSHKSLRMRKQAWGHGGRLSGRTNSTAVFAPAPANLGDFMRHSCCQDLPTVKIMQ